jgi:hypothetical protein
MGKTYGYPPFAVGLMELFWCSLESRDSTFCFQVIFQLGALSHGGHQHSESLLPLASCQGLPKPLWCQC